MLIVHRCTCGHNDFFHFDTTRRHNQVVACMACPCEQAEPDAGLPDTFGEPEVIPSWDPHLFSEATLNPEIIEPGTFVHGLGQLCGCDVCHELYRTELARVAA